MAELFFRARIYTNLFFIVSILFISFLLSACGGGGGSSGPTQQSGVFIDSAVEGIEYTSGNISGTTGSGGSFLYEEGNTVTFKVGDIVIGTATGQAVITPVNLVPGATDETDPTVTNIVQFLLTIDDDGIPGNGIQISADVVAAAAGQTIDFTVAPATFVTDTTSVIATLTAATTACIDATAECTNVLISSAEAQAHLSETLLTTVAGIYNGTFSGDSSGTWSVTVDAAGNVEGSACNVSDGNYVTNVSGQVTSDGNSTVGVAGYDTVWSGSFSLTGEFSGTWASTLESGVFSGAKAATSSGGTCTSEGGVPGGGGSSGSGSLSISGADTPSLGSTFGPVLVTIPFVDPATIRGTISWSSTADFETTFVGRVVGFVLNPSTNTPLELRFADSETPGQLWAYELLCSSGDCSGITINQQTKTVSFDNVVLPVQSFEGNSATAAITLTGSLTY